MRHILKVVVVPGAHDVLLLKGSLATALSVRGTSDPPGPPSLREALVIVLFAESLWADDTRPSFSRLCVQAALAPGLRPSFHSKDYMNL